MRAFLLMLLLLVPTTTWADEKEEEDLMSPGTFSGLALRNIGPALMSGRISDIAVHPEDRSVWYVTVACGGVWKTVNAGTTWTPIFDDQPSYSIGCVAIDPLNPFTVWVGTGENNSQRSVGYGDGVYKSLDGGKHWKRMGLENSGHTGKILIDPRDSKVVYVAAQGPLWSAGGDRGLYKTVDGGETWTCVLEISENTGVSDMVFDPRDPDVLYASSYQRRRHVWTLISGGKESAIYKSVDAGATWKKLEGGLPSGHVGRAGLAVSPIRPDVVYALIEASGDAGGFFRSTDAGANWEKRSGYRTTSGQYYQEIYCDPFVFDRVYSMDTRMMVTNNGGKTFSTVGEKFKHVDNHALVFDDRDPEYLLAGCDGGVYESFDRGKTWNFKANLPITQFYKLCVDNELPFYNVYGGTQDNNTQGGPSRTRNVHGIRNSDWFITVGGDGFEPQVDPLDPNIVYSQSQHGVLSRYDRRSGERTGIQPQPEKGEEALRWNWDAPLLISPHLNTRLYFAANRLFRSDDRGDSWNAVSPDLTRRIDRNKLKVMGAVQSVDAVAKSKSTSYYGNIVSLTESPLLEGLIWVGTDDGLIQVSSDSGGTWQEIGSFPGIPELSYVADLEASLHSADRVYAAFNNHKMGDFAPYIMKSDDRGKTWTSVAGDLPERGSVWALAEDHVDENLLFAGTEFGVFFTLDGGAQWIRLKGGVPTIAMRDLEIQRRENDLVCASFGRSFYILDDYTPLRGLTKKMLDQEAVLFPVKKALMYIKARPLGGREKASQGDAFFTAPNPPFGAVFTYHLKEGLKTRKKRRQETEKKVVKEEGEISYPTWDELRLEDREQKPEIILTVKDPSGEVVRRITGPTGKGFHRVAWDLRYPAFTPAKLGDQGSGPMAVPGTYTVELSQRVDDLLTPLGEAQAFEAVPLEIATLPAEDRAELLAFQRKLGRLQRAVLGAGRAVDEAMDRVKHIKKAAEATPGAENDFKEQARKLELRLLDLKVQLNGDPTLERRMEPTPPSIVSRVQRAVRSHWNSSTSAPTATQRRAYEIAGEAFTKVLEDLTLLEEQDLKQLEEALESELAPWTPGRIPRWIPE